MPSRPPIRPLIFAFHSLAPSEPGGAKFSGFGRHWDLEDWEKASTLTSDGDVPLGAATPIRG